MYRPTLKYYDIAPNVTAFSTTRHGGHGEGSYGGFNINRYCGDNETNIAENRRELCSLLCIKAGRLIVPHQVHGTEICCIDEEALRSEKIDETTDGMDAVMTNLPDTCIGVSTADCIPIIIYDTGHHAACAIHAGWRGTANRIAAKAVAAMRDRYGSRPSDMHAVIGPGISLKNFEVGEEVYEEFLHKGFNMELISRKFPYTAWNAGPGATKWHIDLWECNRLQLADAGVKAGNINVAGICTYDNVNEFFSARRLGIKSGRIYTGIVLR